jgi:hypothetical protein
MTSRYTERRPLSNELAAQDIIGRLLIDDDLRRRLRHTLPVASETVNTFISQAFGYCPRERDWRDFLTLLDSVLGLCEVTPGLLAVLEDHTLLSSELQDYAMKLDVVKRLGDYATVLRLITDMMSWSGKQKQRLLFKVDVDEVNVQMLSLRYSGQIYAYHAVFESEITCRPAHEIVLIKGWQADRLLRLFPRYWREMRVFRDSLEEIF